VDKSNRNLVVDHTGNYRYNTDCQVTTAKPSTLTILDAILSDFVVRDPVMSELKTATFPITRQTYLRQYTISNKLNIMHSCKT